MVISSFLRLFSKKETTLRLDPGASFVVRSSEGKMTFQGYSSSGPVGAELREGVARRRARLYGER